MTTDTKAVETKVETAAAQSEVVATQTAAEVDYEALLKQKDEEIAQTRTERENYRKGMLKAKGKLPSEDDSDDQTSETNEEMVRRITREEMLRTKEAQLVAEKDAALRSVIKRNKELEVALKNRGQVTSTSAAGSNEDRPEVKVEKILSTEQLNALKKKGFTDKMIEDFKKNLNRVNDMPK